MAASRRRFAYALALPIVLACLVAWTLSASVTSAQTFADPLPPSLVPAQRTAPATLPPAFLPDRTTRQAISIAANPLANASRAAGGAAAGAPPGSQPVLPAPAQAPGKPSLNSAFARDTVLANGSHQVMVSPSPINYLDASGAWQPIDPRFETVAGGFVDNKNVLQISAGKQQSMLRVQNGQQHVGWESQALVLTSAGGQTQTLASVLDAAHGLAGALANEGSTIRYAHNWTATDLVEEISTRAGAVEQSLILGARPATGALLGSDGGAYLTLRATLHLLPGSTLNADGIQTRAFTTTGAIEFRSAVAQETVVLDPARAFEQAHPAAGVSARYRFTPAALGEWLVEIDTPWSWWADPARVYPVVLDPTMRVLHPFAVAQVSENGPTQTNGCLPGTASTDSIVFVGATESYQCGALRALIRFDSDLLPKPPRGNTQISTVKLFVVPTGGNIKPPRPDDPSNVSAMPANLYQTNEYWTPGLMVGLAHPTITGTAIPVEGDGSMTVRSVPGQQPVFQPTIFDLQTGASGIFSDWLANPSNNNGLVLKRTDETACFPGNPYYNACDYVTIPTGGAQWNPADKNNQSDFTSGGFMLQIEYTPPDLSNRVPIGYNPALKPPTASDDTTYFQTYHTYGFPVASGWQVVGVKGLTSTAGLAQQFQSAGDLGISACEPDPNCQQRTSGNSPNYLALNNSPLGAVEVYAPSSDPQAAQYAVESVNASSQITLPGDIQFGADSSGTGLVTKTFSMLTDKFIDVFNLDLVENRRVHISVAGGPYGPLTAHLFSPQAGPNLTQANHRDDNGSAVVNPGEGGTWALVVTYGGDAYFGDFPPLQAITLTVIACPLYAIATSDGCLWSVKPDPSTPNQLVGPYRVWSPADFATTACPPPDGSNTCTTTRLTANDGRKYAGYVTWDGDSSRLVEVAGPIVFNASLNLLGGTPGGEMLLALDPPGVITQVVPLWSGDFRASFTGDGIISPYGSAGFESLPLAAADAPGAGYTIDVRQDANNTMHAIGMAALARPVEFQPNSLQALNFNLTWWVRADGYPPIYSQTVNTGGPISVEVGSVAMLFGNAWTMEYTPPSALNPNGLFTNLRNQGKVALPDKLGGRWLVAQAVILPRHVTLSYSLASCQGYCVDVRDASDAPGAPNPHWKMPDVVVSGAAGTLMFSRPGELEVYSKDHPDPAKPMGAQPSFSMQAFDSQVSVIHAACPGSGDPSLVTVVSGSTTIALPGLGDDPQSSPGIASSFTLCQGKLHEVHLEFHADPGLPVGDTGAWVNNLSGAVVIDPDHTELTFGIGFYVGDSAAVAVADGNATVKIDTRGLFDLQAHGGVLKGAVSYDGHMWVAWNPLDVGVDLTAQYPASGDWLVQGQVHAHVWTGQGWQHKYAWLPDDGEKHFAGSFQANFKVNQGQAFSWWWIDIPPVDLTFSFEFAFGQFCVNDPCTAYEWAIKGSFSVLDYDIGLYYGFDSGFDFILGSDNHVLIDQYGGFGNAPVNGPAVRRPASPLIGGRPAAWQVRAVPNALAAVYAQPFTVTANTGSFMAALSWDYGTPALSLIDPAGHEITSANFISYGLKMASSSNSLVFGLRNPAAGVWQLKVSHADATNNYHLTYFANRKPPPASLLTPAASNESPLTTTYRINWTVPPSSNLLISLYYTATNAGALTTTQQVGGVIRENYTATSGFYDWDMSYLGSGTYHIYARVFEAVVNAGGWERRPLSTTQQLPGFMSLAAPGTVVYTDTTAPPVPANLTLSALNSAAEACWDASAAHDLVGYIVHYTYQAVDGTPRDVAYRIHANAPYSGAGARECAHISGLNALVTTSVQVASVDAGDNASGYTPFASIVVSPNHTSHLPLPTLQGSVAGADHSVHLSWTASNTLTGVTYRVYYARDTAAGPGQVSSGANEGASPVDAGNATSAALHNLLPGCTYHFKVQAYQPATGLRSALSNDVALVLTNGADPGARGMPDDWAACYGITDPSADPDHDGLTNREEYQIGTNPLSADTDGDGYPDGTEHVCGSNPLDANSVPPVACRLPHMQVTPARLSFKGFPLDGIVLSQTVVITNIGGGLLTPTISTSASWLSASLAGDKLLVTVNKAGLDPDHYSGSVSIGSTYSHTLNSPQVVQVDLWLAAGQAAADKPWDKRFALPGLDGSVRAIVVSGSTTYVGGDFSLADGASANYIAQWTGSAWAPVGNHTGSQVYALAIAPNGDLYTGEQGGNVQHWDGSSWHSLGSGLNGTVAALVVSGTEVYAGGQFGVSRWNGTAWSTFGGAIQYQNSPGYVSALAVYNSALYIGGFFNSAGGASVTHTAAWNGTTWLPLGTGTDGEVSALAISGGALYVGGYFANAGGAGSNHIARWNGGWSALGIGVDGPVTALTAAPGGVYVGGNFANAGGTSANHLARWNGSWSAPNNTLGCSGDGCVLTLALSGSDLYVGGQFDGAGGKGANNSARLNGGSWNALSAGGKYGVNYNVDAMLSSGEGVYIAGDFSTAGATAAGHIARWNGAGWSMLAEGLSGGTNFGAGHALARSGTDLYVAGTFTMAGQASANSIARWDGSHWFALDGGIENSNGLYTADVLAIAVTGTRVYAGGSFDLAGGAGASNIAAWDGAAWSSLGGGITMSSCCFSPQVSAIAVRGDEVYVGGIFDRAGGSAINSLARWNGTSHTWSAVGGGISGCIGFDCFVSINAIAVAPNGDVYVGGNFAHAGAVVANAIARWDGSQWSALGNGISMGGNLASVNAIAFRGSSVYVGGTFNTAGGVSASYVAKWDGAQWSTLGSGVGDSVRALAATTDSIWVGGQFQASGGKIADHVAGWLLAPTAVGSVTPGGGGTVSTPDGSFSIQFPPNAYSVPLTVKYFAQLAPSQPPRAGSLSVLSFVLEAMTGDGQLVTQFQQPYTMTIHFTDAQLAALGIDKSSLNVVIWNGSNWVSLFPCAGCSVDTVNDRITLVLNHFTQFDVTGTAGAAHRLFLPLIRR